MSSDSNIDKTDLSNTDYSSDYADKKHQYVYDKIQKHYPNALVSLKNEKLPSTYKNCILRAFHKNNVTNLIEGYIDKYGNYHQLLKPIEDKDSLIKIRDPLNKLKDIKSKNFIDSTTQNNLERYINSSYMIPKNKDVSFLYNHHDNMFLPIRKSLKRNKLIHVLLLIKYYKVHHTKLYKLWRTKSIKKIKLPSKLKLPLLSKKSPIKKESTSESSQYDIQSSDELSIEPSEPPSEPPSDELSIEPYEHPSEDRVSESSKIKEIEIPVSESHKTMPVSDSHKEMSVSDSHKEIPVSDSHKEMSVSELPVVKKISIKKKYRILKDRNGKVIGRIV